MWPDRLLYFSVVSLALLGCQGTAESGTVTVVSGSALVLDPWKVADHTSLQVQRYWLFDTPFRHSPDGRPVPHLVQAWDTVAVPGQPDSVDVVLVLRSGVMFHDGSPLTSRDVATTFLRALDPETAFPYADRFLGYSPSVEVLDDSTVRTRASRHARILHAWTVLPILPDRVLSAASPRALAQSGVGEELIGSGPFRFDGRRSRDEWVFRRHALNDPPGSPDIERLVYRVRPDHSALTVELLTGAADLYFPVAPDLIGRIDRSQQARVLEGGSRDWTFIVWNTRVAPVSDLALRRALGLALDRPALIRASHAGRGTAGDGVLPPGHPAFERRIPAHDRDAAESTLDSLGWLKGPDGMRRSAAGRPFQIHLMVHSGSAPQRSLAEAVQYQLGRTGVDVRIRFLEIGTLVDRLTRPLPDGGRDFEAALLTWSDQVPKDDRQLFHSLSASSRWGVSGIHDTQLDALLDSLASVPSDADRPDLWRRYRDRLTEVSPVTVLLYPPVVVAVSERLRGVSVDARGELAGARGWRLGHPGQ